MRLRQSPASESAANPPAGGASIGTERARADRRRFYRGWWVVLLAFLLQIFAAGPVYYAFGNYSVMFTQEYGASRTTINFAYTLIVLVGALGSAPVGWLADRWPIRRLCMIGVVVTSCGLALVAATDAMWQVVLLFGIPIAAGDIFLGNVSTNFMISHWFERRRGLALGLSILGASIAAMVFPPMTSALFGQVGWRATFVAYGLATLLLAVPVRLFAHLPRQVPEFELRVRTTPALERRRLGFAALARVPAFWIISLCTGVMIGVNGAVMISMVPYATGRGFGGLDAAFLVSIIGGGAFAGKLLFGIIADRVDLRWALRAGLAMMAAAVLLLFAGGSYSALAAASIIFGIGLGGMIPVWGAIVAFIFGLGSCGSALGGTRAAMTPFAVACPLIAGQVFDRTGRYDLAWMIFAALLLVSLAATFLAGNWVRPVSD